ncbi:MAG TPA: hypothetical protein VLA92_02970 [Candidatus Saccharimonadales bacterium]|nr:hypothetical protein [Candidatus Saccharimonadales bacterium]
MITYVEATFLGHDGEFQNKHTYQLKVVQHWGKKLSATATHGYDFKPVRDMMRTYRHLGEFLREWQIKRVVRGPVMPGDGSESPS